MIFSPIALSATISPINTTAERWQMTRFGGRREGGQEMLTASCSQPRGRVLVACLI